MQIPKKKQNRARHKEKLIEKKCRYPGCENIFFGTGATKYCKEHKNYKAIMQMKQEVKVKKDTINQIIEHDGYPQNIIIECALEGCTTNFVVRLLHGVKVYPKFCPEHRNEYKRKLFSKTLKRT